MARLPRAIRLLALVLSLVLSVAAAAAQDSAGDDALLRALGEQLAAGRHEEALATARRAAEHMPGNPAVWYNLAGLEELHGDREAALAALRQATLVGFDDFRFADRDEDLGALRRDPGFRALREAWADGLAARAAERRLTLEAGAWSPPVELVDRRGGLDPPDATARLRVTGDHLEVEVLAEMRPVGMLPPWRGGTGLLLAVVLPEDPDTGEGRLFAEFGVGMAEGVPVGALRLGEHWQRLAELTPKLRRDDESGRLRVSFVVPWTVCDPIHPLVDPELGLNLTWLRGGAADAGRAAWIEDPAAGRADRAWRRSVPLRMHWSEASGPVVAARFADRVVRDGIVRLDPLAAVGESTTAVELAVRDRAGVLRRQANWSLTGPGARRSVSDTLQVALPAGSVRLGANAGEATWESDLVALPAGWEAAMAEGIATAPARERPSLNYRLDAVERALAARHPRQDPSAVGATVNELEELLARVAERGTSLPEGGSYLAVAPGEPGAPDRLCSLALPDGWRRGAPARALLLLARAPGQEQQAVLRAPRLLAERATSGADAEKLVVAVAHLGPFHDAAAARRLGEQLLDWLRDFVDVDRVHLAGVDLLGATALELGATRADAVAGVLLVTGMNFVPYPGLAPGALPAPLDELPLTMPVGWIWFLEEQRPGDQAGPLQEALRARGVDVAPARPVSGGLDFSQAWTRAVVWASESGR